VLPVAGAGGERPVTEQKERTSQEGQPARKKSGRPDLLDR